MFVAELIQYIFLGLFLGGMYNGGFDYTVERGVYNRCAGTFFVLSILIFTPPFTAIQTFSLERALFWKERNDKLYHTSSWIVAKSLVSAPIKAAFCLAFTAICYFMCGYQARADKFFLFFAMLALFQISAEATGLLFSIATKSPVYAIVWMSLVLIVALSLTGFLTYDMPVYYKWIQDANILRFALLALLKIEFEGLTFVAADGLAYEGIDAIPAGLKPTQSLGTYFGITIVFLIGLKLLAYLFLVLQESEPTSLLGCHSESSTLHQKLLMEEESAQEDGGDELL